MGAYPNQVVSSVATSGIVVINLPANPYFGSTPAYAIGVICTVAPGSVLTYSVQVTGDQLPSQSGHWNDHDTLVSLTSSANGNIAFPVTGVRLSVAAYTNGGVNLSVVQWP